MKAQVLPFAKLSTEGVSSSPDQAGDTGPAEAVSRETVRIPHVTIHAFCGRPDTAAAIEAAAGDRLMGRTHLSVRMGGISAATEFYEQAATPNLVIVESLSSQSEFLGELDRLAEVCDAGMRVMAIGHINDIVFYREMLKRGVSDYLLAPVDAVGIITAVSRVYGEEQAEKLGRTCAFIGARGGVGSSTIAQNVGWSLARKLNLDVVLADLDLPFGTAGLNFNIETASGIAEALQDAGRVDEVLLDRLLTRHGDHFSLLPSPASLDRAYDVDENALEPLLDVARSSMPFTILDMPHVWTAWARKALISADEIVITAAPDLASLRNAKNLIDTLREARPHDPPPKLVLNQVGMPKRPEIKPKDFAKTVQLEPVACIPFDAHSFGTAANKGQMVSEAFPRATASRIFEAVADQIAGRQRAKTVSKGILGSFRAHLKR